jgi:hypothetical protein
MPHTASTTDGRDSIPASPRFFCGGFPKMKVALLAELEAKPAKKDALAALH